MTPAQFKAWRIGMGYTPHQAAVALDLSRETVRRYETGAKVVGGEPVAIPHTVDLACRALKAKLPPFSD